MRTTSHIRAQILALEQRQQEELSQEEYGRIASRLAKLDAELRAAGECVARCNGAQCWRQAGHLGPHQAVIGYGRMEWT